MILSCAFATGDFFCYSSSLYVLFCIKVTISGFFNNVKNSELQLNY